MFRMKVKLTLFFTFSSFFVYATNKTQFSVLNPSEYKPPCSVTTLFKQITEIKVNHRNIYGLFTRHPTIDPDYVYKIIINYPKEHNNKLIQLVRKHFSLAESEKKDVSTIVQFLRSKPAIHWIGIEVSKEELTKGLSIQALVKQYKDAKIWLNLHSKEDTERLLHLMFPNYMIAIAEHPEIFRNIKFIPIDSHFHKMKGVALIQKIERTRERMIDKMRNARVPFAKFSDIESLKNKALRTAKKVPQPKINTVLGKLKNSEIRQLVANYFSYINQFIETADQRSNTMASLALKQSGEGLIIVGSAHRRRIVEGLLSMCRGL